MVYALWVYIINICLKVCVYPNIIMAEIYIYIYIYIYRSGWKLNIDRERPTVY
jgi:hypothetical protein